MRLSASSFIRNRNDVIAITNDRIEHIIWYILDCYQSLILDKPLYSKQWIRENTTHKTEDYLKMELVDRYLTPRKDILKSRISQLEEINFDYETQKRYVDVVDSREKIDKIDIYINKLGLNNVLKNYDENAYFSIECKRIKILSDTQDYILDIQKFTQRNHTNTRLPFEGMLAFIENKKLTHSNVSAEVNNRLVTNTTIVTENNLTPYIFYSGFLGTYSSIHLKNYGKNNRFSIYHLLLDYSDLVVD